MFCLPEPWHLSQRFPLLTYYGPTFTIDWPFLPILRQDSLTTQDKKHDQ